MTDTLAQDVAGKVVRSELDGRPAWVVQTRTTAIVLGLGPDDTLLLPHWGARGESASAADYLPYLPGNRRCERDFVDGLPRAYPVYGEASFKEPSLVVSRDDGARGVRLAFVADRIARVEQHTNLELEFRDDLIGLVVTLRF